MIACRQCQEYLKEFALSDESSMSPEIQQHLDECIQCRGELARLRDAWSLMGLAAESQVVTSDMESRLMGRVESCLKNPGGERWPRATFVKYGLAATVLISVISLALIWSRQHAEETRLALRQARKLQEQLDQFDQWKRGFANPRLHVVSLQDVTSTSRARAYLVHDVIGEEGHFFALDVDKPSPGWVFKVWVLAKSGQVCGSSVLVVNDKGMAAATLAMPEDAHRIERVVVTAEQDPDAAIPSSAVRLQAAVD